MDQVVEYIPNVRLNTYQMWGCIPLSLAVAPAILRVHHFAHSWIERGDSGPMSRGSPPCVSLHEISDFGAIGVKPSQLRGLSRVCSILGRWSMSSLLSDFHHSRSPKDAMFRTSVIQYQICLTAMSQFCLRSPTSKREFASPGTENEHHTKDSRGKVHTSGFRSGWVIRKTQGQRMAFLRGKCSFSKEMQNGWCAMSEKSFVPY